MAEEERLRGFSGAGARVWWGWLRHTFAAEDGREFSRLGPVGEHATVVNVETLFDVDQGPAWQWWLMSDAIGREIKAHRSRRSGLFASLSVPVDDGAILCQGPPYVRRKVGCVGRACPAAAQ